MTENVERKAEREKKSKALWADLYRKVKWHYITSDINRLAYDWKCRMKRWLAEGKE